MNSQAASSHGAVPGAGKYEGERFSALKFQGIRRSRAWEESGALPASRPRWKRFSEGHPRRPLLLSEITNPFIFLTRGTACLNCWAVTLELDARTPHIHDVAKNLHNVTKNKVMETQREALYSWVLDPESFTNAGKPARCWCLAEGADCVWPRGMERESGTVVSQQPRRQPGTSPRAVLVPVLVPQLLPFLSPTGKRLIGHSRNMRKILLRGCKFFTVLRVWNL